MTEFCKINDYPMGVKEYCYDVFSQESMNDVINHLDEEYYSNPEMCDPDRPGTQTIQCLFDDPKFQLISTTFLESVRQYVNIPELVSKIDLKMNYDISSWCYLNWKTDDHNDPGGWHQHNENGYADSIAGIFYLKLPESQGGETMFHVGGNFFELPSIQWSWFIFPGVYWHCPGEVYSPDKRYVIGADISFTNNVT